MSTVYILLTNLANVILLEGNASHAASAHTFTLAPEAKHELLTRSPCRYKMAHPLTHNSSIKLAHLCSGSPGS